MEKKWSLYFGANTLLVVVTIAACTGYLALLYQGHTQQQQYQIRIKSLEQSQQALERELAGNQYSHKRLQGNLTVAEENRKQLESHLLDLQTQNWQEKFETAHHDNLLLEQQQWANETEIARLDRAVTFLIQHNNVLKTELADAKNTQRALEAGHLAAIAAREKQLRKLDEKLQRQQLEIKDLKSQTQPVAAANIEKLPLLPAEGGSINKKPGIDLNSTGLPAGGPNDNQITDTYRQVRLQSLANAMQGKPSAIRRNILISVIPTIPGGISGDELLPLISGMESADILMLIQTAGNHLVLPLSQETLSILIASMNEADAETAHRVLVNH